MLLNHFALQLRAFSFFSAALSACLLLPFRQTAALVAWINFFCNHPSFSPFVHRLRISSSIRQHSESLNPKLIEVTFQF